MCVAALSASMRHGAAPSSGQARSCQCCWSRVYGASSSIRLLRRAAELIVQPLPSPFGRVCNPCCPPAASANVSVRVRLKYTAVDRPCCVPRRSGWKSPATLTSQINLSLLASLLHTAHCTVDLSLTYLSINQSINQINQSNQTTEPERSCTTRRIHLLHYTDTTGQYTLQ